MSNRRYLKPLLCIMVMGMGHLVSGVIMAQTGPSLAGCPILPADNVWNTPIDGLPIDPNSEAYIAAIGGDRGVHPDFGSGLWEGAPIGIPYNIVPGTQPKVKITFDYDDESDPGPYPIPPGAEIEGGYNSDGDRHILVIDEDHCILYETWSTYPQPDGSWQAGSGAIFDLQSNALRPSGWTSADAAGLPILPGLVRYDEVASGEIRHAIRFTVPKTRKEFIWPARHYASNLTGLNYPPMGQRFRLKADFDISGFSPTVQVILRALKRYGMILADNGSAWFISGVPDSRWDNELLVGELAQVKVSDFEAVDESSLMIDPDSGQARQEGPVKITLSSPPDGERFDACSYYTPVGPPTFVWNNNGNIFKSIEVQFSTGSNFSAKLVKVKGSPPGSTLSINSSNWKKILLLPGPIGGRVYWKVAGIKSDNSKVESDPFSFIVEGPMGVGNPRLSHTSRTTAPPPTLSLENECNSTFKVWFGSDSDFTKPGIKKKALSFNIKNPNDDNGVFIKALTSGQWMSIRKLVNDLTGPTIYWYVESWDGLGRYSKTEPMNFLLTN